MNKKYSAEVVVGITGKGDLVFYDIVDIKPTSFKMKKEESPTTATTQKAIGDIQGDPSIDKIRKNDENVNPQYSLSSPAIDTRTSLLS